MNLRRHRLRTPEVNLTPLIDVVFLLLIFFMVSTTFQKETQIKIQLPEASAEAELDLPTEQLDITVDREGRFYVNQRQVINTELATLKRAIGKAAKGAADLPVIITADALTPHQAVIQVMDAASSLGFVNMTFAAKQREEPE